LVNANSPIVAVNPNPVIDKLRVTVQSQFNDNAIFILNDVSGRQLFRKSKPLFPGTNLITLGENSQLASGTYLLTMISSEGRHTVKVVKSD
jgi:hypothetical protein